MNPEARPILNAQNKMLEVEAGASLLTRDFGKTFVKHVIKIGHCKYCWGPAHGRKEVCMYRALCKECLCIEKSLPHNGFHHACRSLIESTADPLKRGYKGKRKASFDPGAPTQPQMATYTPTSNYQKKQKLLEEAQSLIKKRKILEAEVAGAAAAIEAEARNELIEQDRIAVERMAIERAALRAAELAQQPAGPQQHAGHNPFDALAPAQEAQSDQVAYTDDMLDYNDPDNEEGEIADDANNADNDEVCKPYAAWTDCVGSFRPQYHGYSRDIKQYSRDHTGYPIGTACQGQKYSYNIILVAPSSMLLAIDISIIFIGIICLYSLFKYHEFRCAHSDSEHILPRYYGALSRQNSIVTLLFAYINSQIALEQGELIFNYNSDLG